MRGLNCVPPDSYIEPSPATWRGVETGLTGRYLGLNELRRVGSWCDRTSVLIRHQRALSLPSSTCTRRRGRWAHSKMAATRQPREESPEWKLPCRHLKLGRPASRTVGNKRLLGKRPQSMVFYHAATAGKHTRQATTCGSPCKLNPTLTGLRLFNKMSPLVACLNVAATSHSLGGSRMLTLRFCASLTVDLWTYASLQTTLQPALDYLVFLWLVFKSATFSLNTELEIKAWLLNTLETRHMLWGERNDRDAQDSIVSYPGEIP